MAAAARGDGSAGAAQTASGGLATVGVANSGLGNILVNSNGRTLYLFQKDSGMKSACSGACASAWPPVRANGKPTVGGGANASLVGTTARSDGEPQVTYNGQPLYLYQGDQKPGDMNGQGLTGFGAPGGCYPRRETRSPARHRARAAADRATAAALATSRAAAPVAEHGRHPGGRRRGARARCAPAFHQLTPEGASRPSTASPAQATGPTKVLLASTSLRAESANSAVLRTAAALAGHGIRTSLFEGLGAPPHLNPDDDSDGGTGPAAVADRRRRLADEDALLFCTPEYAGGGAHDAPRTLLDYTGADIAAAA